MTEPMVDITQPIELSSDEANIVELARLAYVAAREHAAPNWALDLMVGGLDKSELHRAAGAWREFSFEPGGFAFEVERLARNVE